MISLLAGVNRAKNLTVATRLALENPQRQLNAARSSNVGSGRADNEVWVELDS